MVRTRTTVKPGLLLQPFVVAQLGGRLIERVVEGSGITGGEFALTSWLNSTGRATPSEIAQSLGLAPTTVSAMVDRLVRKGQVKKVRNPDDGRSYLLEPTAKGRATHARCGARFVEVIAQVRDTLEGDEEEILAAMRTLEAALRTTLE
jgi:DNA-binding MarR family transcriptional regulator